MFYLLYEWIKMNYDSVNIDDMMNMLRIYGIHFNGGQKNMKYDML